MLSVTGTGFQKQVVNTLPSPVIRLADRPAAKVIEAAGNHLDADVVIAVSGRHMGIIGGGSGVIEGNRRNQTNFPPLLLLYLFGNGLAHHLLVDSEPDGAAVGLVPA